MTLRNRLHVGQPAGGAGGGSNNSKPDKSPSSGAPAVPPRTSLAHSAGGSSGHTLTASALVHQQQHSHGTAGSGLSSSALNGSRNHLMTGMIMFFASLKIVVGCAGEKNAGK